MEHLLSLLRMALERGWALGALLAVFFGAALVGSAFGLALPALVLEWSAAGLLFGLTVLTISVANHLSQAIRRSFHEGAAERHATEEAFKNLSSLTREELEIVRDLLRDGPRRFEVHIVSNWHNIMAKGVFVPVRDMPGVSWLCEIHPALLKRRDEIVTQLDQVLSNARD